MNSFPRRVLPRSQSAGTVRTVPHLLQHGDWRELVAEAYRMAPSLMERTDNHSLSFYLCNSWASANLG